MGSRFCLAAKIGCGAWTVQKKSPVKRFFVRPGNPVSSSRPAVSHSRRAQELSRLAVTPPFPRAMPLPGPYLDSSEHGGTFVAVGMTIRGEPAFRARRSIAPQPCIRWVQDPNHDAVIRISERSSEAAGPFFSSAQKPWHKPGLCHLEPSSTTRHMVDKLS